jgi:hypothetical protein
MASSGASHFQVVSRVRSPLCGYFARSSFVRGHVRWLCPACGNQAGTRSWSAGVRKPGRSNAFGRHFPYAFQDKRLLPPFIMKFRLPVWNRRRGSHVAVSSVAGRGVGALEWREREPLPGGNIVALSVNAEGFWLVGEGASGGTTVMVSSDGEHWAIRRRFTQTLNARCLVVGRTGLVLGCAGGGILTSVDGVVWKRRPALIPNAINCGASGDGVLILGAERGGVLRTDDEGGGWAYFYSGFSDDFYSLAYGAGIFVATTRDGKVLRSKEGVDWRKCLLQAGVAGVRVGFANGRFVLTGPGGALLSSADGDEWTRHAAGTEESLYGVAYYEGEWTVLAGRGLVYRSVDAVVWHGSRVPGVEWRGPLVCAGGVYIAGAGRGLVMRGGAAC